MLSFRMRTHYSRLFRLVASVQKVAMSYESAKRIEGLEKNVWVELNMLSNQYNPVNLGQGYPDFAPPEYVTKALAEATNNPNALFNQYTRSYGHLRLVKILAQLYEKLLSHSIDPLNEILITNGAYGALFCAIQGLVEQGDEVIIIEPFFDCYAPMVKMAGGTPVYVPLRPSKSTGIITSADWMINPEELESKCSDKTKIIIHNCPNNPLGKVYTKNELEMIANLCLKYNVILLSDEVYEWLVYANAVHIRMATLPGMWDRTITIGSAGKTFSVTGWKTGWAIGPKNLIRIMQTVHQNVSYTCATPLQEAIALGFELEIKRINQSDCYFQELPAMLLPKRDRMVELLNKIGMVPIIPEGGYFIMADYSKMKGIQFDTTFDEPKDYQFIRWLIREKKIAAIPPSVFYSDEHKHLIENYVRFCFIKNDTTLEEAAKIFENWQA